jgi:hypothetical protein
MESKGEQETKIPRSQEGEGLCQDLEPGFLDSILDDAENEARGKASIK